MALSVYNGSTLNYTISASLSNRNLLTRWKSEKIYIKDNQHNNRQQDISTKKDIQKYTFSKKYTYFIDKRQI